MPELVDGDAVRSFETRLQRRPPVGELCCIGRDRGDPISGNRGNHAGGRYVANSEIACVGDEKVAGLRHGETGWLIKLRKEGRAVGKTLQPDRRNRSDFDRAATQHETKRNIPNSIMLRYVEAPACRIESDRPRSAKEGLVRKVVDPARESLGPRRPRNSRDVA